MFWGYSNYADYPYGNYSIELGALVTTGYQVFDDSWSTEVPEHKQELCQKILRHYWFYQIGQTMPDKFRHYINEHLARIMPYYNQLYRSEMIKFDPLVTRLLDHTLSEDEKAKLDEAFSRAGHTGVIRNQNVADKRTTDFVSDEDIHNEHTDHDETVNDWNQNEVSKEVTDDDTTHTLHSQKDTTSNRDRTQDEEEKTVYDEDTTSKTDEKEHTGTDYTSDQTTDKAGTQDDTTHEKVKSLTNTVGTQHWIEHGGLESTQDLKEETHANSLLSDFPQCNLDADPSVPVGYWTKQNKDDTEHTSTVTTKQNDVKEHEGDTHDSTTVDGTTDGTLDRDTTEKTDFDQTDRTDVDRELTVDTTGTKDSTTERTENITENEKYTEGVTYDENGTGTDDKTVDFTKDTVHHETTDFVNVGSYQTDTDLTTNEVVVGNQHTGERMDTDNAESTSRGTTNNVIKNRKLSESGRLYNPSQLLQAFRETFINIDEQIIFELQNEFMEVF